jgi:hypothetical protein
VSEEEIEAARSEFESSLMFDKYELTGGTSGCMIRGASGLYENNYIEAAWRGFLMCWERQQDLLDRLDPMRYIGPGLVGAFKEVSEYDHDPIEEIVVHDMIRASLAACRSTPC